MLLQMSILDTFIFNLPNSMLTVHHMQFLKPNTRRVMFKQEVNTIQYMQYYKITTSLTAGVQSCILFVITLIIGCYTINDICKSKGKNTDIFPCRRRKKKGKKHIHTDKGGWGEFPETGRPEIAHSSIRPKEMLLLFLNVCANREEWKQSLQLSTSQTFQCFQ